MAYKYLFKAFYNKTNEKELKSQIWQHNVQHINIVAMKDIIISGKVRGKKKLFKDLADKIALAEVVQASILVDLASRYKWAMSNSDMNVTKKLKLIEIKKYERRTDQIEMELDWLYNWILALATFVKHS